MKRAEQLPDVPTLDELGLKGFDVATWYGITAPAGTPPAIVDRLASVLGKVLASPESRPSSPPRAPKSSCCRRRNLPPMCRRMPSASRTLIKSANIQGE